MSSWFPVVCYVRHNLLQCEDIEIERCVFVFMILCELLMFNLISFYVESIVRFVESWNFVLCVMVVEIIICTKRPTHFPFQALNRTVCRLIKSRRSFISWTSFAYLKINLKFHVDRKQRSTVCCKHQALNG